MTVVDCGAKPVGAIVHPETIQCGDFKDQIDAASAADGSKRQRWLGLKATVTEHPLDFDGGHGPVFSALGGFTCSICAPAAMTARQLEASRPLEFGRRLAAS